MEPITRDQEYLDAILKELKALRCEVQRLTPQVLAASEGMVELKESEPERKPKPKRKG